MNIILLGAPGSGKGTQGEILASRIGVPRIATGDLLRAAVAAESRLGEKARRYMDQGELVPDDVILGLIREKLASPEAAKGVVMDGFPRTPAQATAVDGYLSGRGAGVDQVVSFDVPDGELVVRAIGRAAAEGRSDDTPDTIRKRLAVYREQTQPLIEHYQKRGIVSILDGTGTIDDVAKRVEGALES
jgi:adenylate kinase